MKKFSRLFGLSLAMLALGCFSAANAFAANLVDGSIGSGQGSCTWANGTTNANPPSALTIENSSINGHVTCTGSVSSATLNNDPNVTFNDAAATATADAVDVTVVVSGITCGYRANNVTLPGNVSTRTYAGSATATKTSGSFFCPSSQSLNASVSFH